MVQRPDDAVEVLRMVWAAECQDATDLDEAGGPRATGLTRNHDTGTEHVIGTGRAPGPAAASRRGADAVSFADAGEVPAAPRVGVGRFRPAVHITRWSR